MDRYDPETAPDPIAWLELDEGERIALAEAHHLASRIELPNVTLHAAIHAAVENQIAEGIEPVVEAMARLAREGLCRHDALHAIGSVLTGEFYETVKHHASEPTDALRRRYLAAVATLTAAEWRRKYGAPPTRRQRHRRR
jgi:hypothetical protein